MSIKLIDKNHDIISSKEYTTCHLAAKILGNYPDSKEGTVHLITAEKVLTMSFFSKLDDLFDDFHTVNVKLFVFDSTTDSTFAPDGPCFIISGTEDMNRFQKVFGENGIHISKLANPDEVNLAYQRHFGTESNMKSLGLGELKADLSIAETSIRNAEAVFLDLSAIQKQDSFFEKSSILGLNIFESCQLLKTAALSDKNKLVFINTEDLDLNSNTEELISLLFWYYLEGYKNRKIEDLENPDHLVYLVDSEFYDQPIKFIKGNITGRWWFVHPEIHEPIACHLKDYEQLKAGKIPDIFMSLI